MDISSDEFEAIVNEAIDSLPEHTAQSKNVAFVIEEEPSEEQRHKMNLLHGQMLFGLYEGIPLTARGNNYSMVLPDKITIFKGPLCSYANSLDELKSQVKRTVWHELAHHFGLNHEDMERRING